MVPSFNEFFLRMPNREISGVHISNKEKKFWWIFKVIWHPAPHLEYEGGPLNWDQVRLSSAD